MSRDPYELLERDLVAAVERRGAVVAGAPERATPPPARRRRGRRVVIVAAAVASSVGAAAWAAGSLLAPGAPVAYRYGAPPTPTAHYGTTVPGSARLLADDVPDPDGGLPWGMRTFRTSRGYGCIQVGRVQDGRLGVLALVRRGGGVRGRNLFHELRPAVVAQATTCLPLDGAGRAFVAVHTRMTTDAAPSTCPGRVACANGTLRTVDAGLLGPRATSIAYRAGGRTRVAGTLGDAGGYLVVQRPVAPATVARRLGGRIVRVPRETPIALTPAGNVITRVTYAGAPACAARPTTSPRGACPDPPGFVLIPQPAPEDVRAPIRAFAAPDRRGIRLRFRAPAAVTDGRSDYNVVIRFPTAPCPAGPGGGGSSAGGGCLGGTYGVGLDRDVRAGELVRTTIDVPNIGPDRRPTLRRGTYRVEVAYRVQPPRPRVTGSLAAPGYRVGSATVRVG